MVHIEDITEGVVKTVKGLQFALNAIGYVICFSTVFMHTLRDISKI